MIVVTDAHVSDGYGNVDPFFAMLKKIAETDEDVVFLGDIFELWIGLKRYEEAIHKDFAGWCKQQKEQRTIGFIEGNHEFYVAHRHRECFSWSSRKGYYHKELGTLFVHGDLINRADKNYLRFRRLSKNPLAKTLVRMMPRGPVMVERLKAKLKTTNQDFRLGLPKQALRSFAETQFAHGVRQIVVGHFHENYRLSLSEDQVLHVLPDWFTHRTVAQIKAKDLSIFPWQEWSP